ncbi:MAG: HAD family phosphatase [Clostridiales Family XIII bacterium]|jgi:HAD superfamily hydrolase (TIGR01509 family)|nr:HAD family phosphatase [Clostridiales Family XIII bacterium]
MNRFQAAIFDLDGTLLDSMGVWAKIDVDFLAKRGFAVPAGYADEICARSFRDAAEYTICLFGLNEKAEDVMEEWRAMAACEYSQNVRLKAHVREYLTQLRQSGVKLAAATGLSEALYAPCLKNNGIYDLFDVLCSTDEAGRGKDHPDVFLLAAEKLGLPPERCVVFEDVLPAVLSAKRAGMTVYGVYDKHAEHMRPEIMRAADGYLCGFGDKLRESEAL